MKKLLLTLVSLVTCLNVVSQESANWKGVYSHPAKIVRDGSKLTIELDLRFDQLDVESEHAIILTPYLMSKENQLNLKAVGIYGKHRYLYYSRRSDGAMLTGKDEISFRSAKRPEQYTYHASVDFQPWMEDCDLMLLGEEYACCRKRVEQELIGVGAYKEIHYVPQFIYVSPAVETVKNRSLSGSAYIDFAVSQIDIRPAYRNNQRELDKIIATINSVTNDPDVSIQHIAIKGYASPEGSYQVNARLAKGRVEALKEYVARLCPQQKELITSSYEAEDWEGLRQYISGSEITQRAAILTLIDSDMDIDKKERTIKMKYPREYKQLLTDCYPALRHSDYLIDYVIRSYTDVEEIKRLIKENPKNLSLQEFYQAAQTYPLGSEEFNAVFEVAVALYPSDEVANLNAANIAMSTGDLKAASRYLEKAGQRVEAIYARGVYEALSKDYQKAIGYFEQAKAGGITKADEALRVVRELDQLSRN